MVVFICDKNELTIWREGDIWRNRVEIPISYSEELEYLTINIWSDGNTNIIFMPTNPRILSL